jgi:hypothetical protein
MTHVGIVSHALQGPSSLVLAKAERSKRPKCLRLSFCCRRLNRASVPRAVGMTKRKPGRNTPLDDELAAVNGTMMGRAGYDERVGMMIPPFRTKLDVMEIEKNAVATAWNHPAPAVTPHHLPTHGGRNILPCAFRRRFG